MDPIPETNALSCTQCGGALHPDEGQIFLTCPFCQSTVFLDKSKVVFHWYLNPTLDEARARGNLFRWMAGNQTVKDLDKKSHLQAVQFEYFPLWFFKRKTAGGAETIYLQPAAATSVTELKRMKLPAGDLRKYDPALDAQAHPPSVPLQAALGWLQQEHQFPAAELAEQALVHLPLYACKYEYRGKTYTAIVEGATGEVFANIFPAKAEAPYLAVGLAAALVYLCLATFPVIGALSGADGGLLGLLACNGLGLLAAPFLFAAAAWVAAKV